VVTVSPTTTTTYTLLVSGPGGVASASATVTVTPPAAPPPLFADTFNRTTGLGAAWTLVSGGFTLDGALANPLASWNEAQVAGFSALNVAVESLLHLAPTGNVGVRSRVSTNRTQGYAAFISNKGVVQLMRRVNNNDVPIRSVTTAMDLTVEHLLRITTVGTGPVAITVSVDGVSLITFSDPTATAITATGGATIVGRSGGAFDSISITTP
jgi:hypothetical protein